jgi:hypothetical protein
VIAQLDRAYVQASGLRTIPRLVSYALFEGRPATTRGQWVNPVVLEHLRMAARWSPERAVDRPVFLVGMGRSGTTLLGRLLSVHPQVGFLNEPKAVWQVISPVEDISGFYNRGPARVRLTAEYVDARTRSIAHALFGHYCFLTRSARVVDKYPELTYRRSFVRAIFPDAVVVAIVRHPSAVVRSVVRWSEANRVGDQDWWGVGSRKWHVLWAEMVEGDPRRRALFAGLDPEAASPRQRAITEWIVAMDELTAPSPDRRDHLDLVVRYEDLVASPVAVIGGILDAAGLPPSDRVEDFARRAVRETASSPGGGGDDWGALQPEVDRLLSSLGYPS